MKTLVRESNNILNKDNSPFIINKNSLEIKLIDFQKINSYHILQLNLANLTRDNYRVFLKGHYLTLIISEPKAYNKPFHVHNLNWDIYNPQSYELMKSVNVWLPEKDYFLIKHYVVKESEVLKVILGKADNN